MNPYQAYVRLDWLPPRASSQPQKSVVFPIDEEFYRKFLAPLPRNREIPFEVFERKRAAEMVMMRQDIVRRIAAEFAERFLEMIASGDPQFGYTPEEWEQLKPPAKA